jgi:Bifunctional DNA primase/polymerase, N-terminal
MLNAALNIAAKGYPVFPVRLCRDACFRCDVCKAPASPHGFQDASLDSEQIQGLWSKYPGQLVGVPTGQASGFDVLDIDSARHPEAASWWMSHRQRVPHTRIHQTGSGGLHVIFKHNELARTGNKRFGEGIDVKANGGYVVWWPSYGRRVSCDAPINEWPDWLITKQQPKVPPSSFPRGGVSKNLEPLAQFVEALREGNRNNGAFWGFCRAYEVVNAGLVSEREAVSDITQAALRTGLGEREVLHPRRSVLLSLAQIAATY